MSGKPGPELGTPPGDSSPSDSESTDMKSMYPELRPHVEKPQDEKLQDETSKDVTSRDETSQPPAITKQPDFLKPKVVDERYRSALLNATDFHVKQGIALLDIVLEGWSSNNVFGVVDQNGNRLFYVGEKSDCCDRICCRNLRPFNLQLKDETGMDVFAMDRQLNCSHCCALLWPDAISVSDAYGQSIGSIVETFRIVKPAFDVKDAFGRTVLRIKGPICKQSCGPCCGEVVFRILDLKDEMIGSINKHWSGCIQELCTNSDDFSASFPHDIDPSIKLLILAALFLINYEYFEKGPNSAFCLELAFRAN